MDDVYDLSVAMDSISLVERPEDEGSIGGTPCSRTKFKRGSAPTTNNEERPRAYEQTRNNVPNRKEERCPNRLVSEPGAGLSKTLKDWLNPFPRFPVHPIPALEEEKQMCDKGRWITRATFPPMDLSSEHTIDKWMDGMARLVNQHALCVDLFMYLVTLNLPSQKAELFYRGEGSTYEEKITSFVLTLFPQSDYPAQLERGLYNPQRQTDVANAFNSVNEHLNSYIRASNRRLRTILLSREQLTLFCLGTLPAAIHEYLEKFVNRRCHWRSLHDLYEDATFAEATLRKYEHKYTGEVAFPVETPPEEIPYRKEPLSRWREANTRTMVPPTHACPQCGDLHWRKDCPHKATRCEQCHKLGHLTKCCHSMVMKTPDGRFDLLLTPKPGSTELHVYKDRTMEDRLQTAGKTFRDVLDNTQHRSAKGKERRVQFKQRQQEGQGPSSNKHRRQALVANRHSEDQAPPSPTSAPEEEIILFSESR